MTLQLRRFSVSRLKLAERTEFTSGTLSLNAAELRGKLMAMEDGIDDVVVHVVQPNESTRILCVKDVIEPRCNVSSSRTGQGALHILKHTAVVTCGPIVGFQEGIIDMSGPGARYSSFSSMPLVALQVNVADGIIPHAHERILRTVGLWTANYLARLTIDLEPDEADHIEWNTSAVDESLPRIAYVCMVLSQGLLHDTYVMGRDAKHHLPLVADPRAIMDTSIVSGNCVSACDKNTTFHYQNNPVIQQLLQGHGRRWNFVGVVITNEPTRLNEKQASAEAAVELVKELDARAVVVTKEGFGNPDADLMMILHGLGQAGIKTVAITDEYAGIDGASHSLADTTTEADAIVSTGNANQRVVLPKMNKTIGPLPDVVRLAGGYPHSLRDDGTLEVELQAIIGATNQLGFGMLSCREV